ncbi:hypothetical protein F2Q70_00034199, partial [Brassica cretica]
MDAQEEHDAAERAAMIAVCLISSARMVANLDSEYTSYSAQFLVDSAGRKNEPAQDPLPSTFTIQDWIQYLVEIATPKPESEQRDSRELIEAKTWEEASKLLKQQPVGAKLHVFSPEFDLVRDEGFYEGPSGPESRYVGLRDVMITGNGRIKGGPFLEVKIVYKKKETFLKVSCTRVLTSLPNDSGEECEVEPMGLLVDFIIPRFS